MSRRPAIASVLDGLVDIRVHSGPSPFPRRFWIRVGEALLDLGLPAEDLRRMVRDNPGHLLGLDA
ncbi:hypothetical protein QF026_000582 [Streptomyces aurantiacus]|uniref:hypothetical protein n=1 Tax=Streptomyces aurantiacus TaxID=47760 RepID=UPI002793CCF2|nr:hypothetical protein [Streptomyces aurantiacus]MDQ0772116.1 hypothetical protein [Streptomyces aurantiacus]